MTHAAVRPRKAPPGQIIIAWVERKAFLRDEERLQRAEQASAREGDRAREDATEAILFSTGDPAAGLTRFGMLCMPLGSVEQIWQRAGMTEPVTDLHSAAFVDRFGTLCLPHDGAEKLARAFASAEPDTVLLYIQDQEAEYKARGYEPGERFWHDYLREKAGGYALARQWAGHEQETEQLNKEFERLRSLITMAAYDLERAGADTEARRIRRALKGQ